MCKRLCTCVPASVLVGVYFSTGYPLGFRDGGGDR